MRPTIVGTLLVVVALIGAGTATATGAVRVSPPSAPPGTVVSVSGVSKASKVTIGGKRARVVRAGRVLVPTLRAGRARVVVRGRGRGRIRVQRAFSGRVSVTLDRGAAERATIGPGGGSLTATRAGTRYELTIPAGALATATAITMTPARRIAGLPLSGRPLGVRLEPDGLTFTTPARLTITPKRPLRGKVAAFATDGSGRSLELRSAGRSGRTLGVSVSHFSNSGAALAVEANLISAAQPLLDALTAAGSGACEPAQPCPSRSVLRQLADLLGAWQDMFPGFCQRQGPFCTRVIGLAQARVPVWIAEACALYRTAPSLLGVSDLFALDAEGQLLTLPPSTVASQCARDVMEAVVQQAVDDLRGQDPFAESSWDTGGARSLDDDNAQTSRFEWLSHVITQSEVSGFGDFGATALLTSTHEALRDRGLILCDSDEAAGDRLLRRALFVSERLGYFRSEMADAVIACHVRVAVTPAEVSVQRLGTVQFTEAITGGLNASGVTWSASGGTISSSGLFTAPDVTGDVTITATSFENPRRTATATVHVTDACSARRTARGGVCLIEGANLLSRVVRMTVQGQACAPACQEEDNDSNHEEFGHFDESIEIDAVTPGAFAFAQSQQESTVTGDAGRVDVEAHLEVSTKTGHDEEPGESAVADADNRLTVTFAVVGDPVGYEISGGFVAADDTELFVRLECDGGEVLSAEQSGSFGQSGTLPAGECELDVFGDSQTTDPADRDAAIDVELVVNGS